MLGVLAAGQDLPLSIALPPKSHPAKPRKISGKTDDFIKCIIKLNPFITSTEIRTYPELLKNVAAHTIHKHLQRHLSLPSCKTIKTMLTKKMKAKRLALAHNKSTSFGEEFASQMRASSEASG